MHRSRRFEKSNLSEHSQADALYSISQLKGCWMFFDFEMMGHSFQGSEIQGLLSVHYFG